MKSDVNEIIEVYTKDIYRIAFMYLNSKSDAEDVVQDVLLKYLSNAPDFESKEHERGWIIQVTINRCKNIRKSCWIRKVSNLSDIEEREYFDSPDQIQIYDSIKGLPPKYKIIVELFYWEDMPIKEISKMLSISDGVVKTRLCRARTKLRKIIEEGDEDDYGKNE